MGRELLGEFEQLVLLAVMHVGEGAYAVPIVEEIERRTGRAVSPAAVYVTLRRLEEKGLVDSTMSAPKAERGGKARRCVRVTSEGVDSLKAARQTLESMWKGLDPGLRRTR